MMKTLLKNIMLTVCIFSAALLHAQPTWQIALNITSTYRLATLSNGYVFGCGIGGMQKSPTGAPFSYSPVTLPLVVSSYSTFIVGNGNNLFMSTYNLSYTGRGIYMTSDLGATWTQKNNGLGGDTAVYKMAVMANGVMIAMTLTGFSYKLYRSTDHGTNWTYIQNVSGYMGSVTPRSATEAYMAAGTDVYKSTDNGLTWNVISSPGISEVVILSSGVFYGTTYNTIMQSLDNGVTWTTVTTTGLPVSVQSGAFIKSPGDTVYYGNIASPFGLYYSANGCLTWNACITGLPSSPDITKHCLLISSNGYMHASPTGDGIYRTSAPVTPAVGVNEQLFAETISVYPNPTAGKIIVNGNAQGTYLFTLYDKKGAMLFSRELSAEKAEIDLSAFAPGNYLLEINDGTRSAFKKIVRE
jgi:hypothetical protein